MSLFTYPAMRLLAIFRVFALVTSVPQPLFFVSTPDDVVRVSLGTELRLTCEVGGTPQPIVQWLKDGRPANNKVSNNFILQFYIVQASLPLLKI